MCAHERGLPPTVGDMGTPQEFVQSFIRKICDQPGLSPKISEDAVQQALAILNQFHDHYLSPSVVNCIERYVQGEMDTRTPGVRGYGRSTESVPRLGGWFRKEIERLDYSKRERLTAMIRQSVCNGYALAVWWDVGGHRVVRKPESWNEEALFSTWVQPIYGLNLEKIGFPEPYSLQAEGWAERQADVFKRQFEKDLRIKVGFLNNLRFLPVVSYYFTAGIWLRITEMDTREYWEEFWKAWYRSRDKSGLF